MRVSDFDFELPQVLIAQEPVNPRDSARLLHITDKFSDKKVIDLPSLLVPGDIMVFNDTKVIPSRLIGNRGESKVEVTLHRQLYGNFWLAFARGSRKLRIGDKIVFAHDFCCKVEEKRVGGEVLLSFINKESKFIERIEKYGQMPLPPYIKRRNKGSVRDRVNYQTMHAKRLGAVAAPTAGLHFTPELMEALHTRGIKTAFITLHVGAGTFLPVRVQKIDDHVMHSEWAELDEVCASRINQARAAGGRVISVGSTSLRVLESAVDKFGELQPFIGETDIFIKPGYKFRVVDKMFTNFHLPRSTLFMLVAALIGLDRIKAAYAHAIYEGYRFFSYGDACLIERPS
ncbi:MAG: tRNA preQ1(34) S-adenosylmethionine ribosyltransferase-isomerase QueA [Pseudomonadota bacterium]|nr:tRNA preQ1(34) S-adenosylmethionine ribosyltransferase-isomerase QueA [Pseudomonadota bacterium]